MSFEKLFTPLKVHGVELANRFVMGSMHTGLEDKWDNYRALTQYFMERAQGGVGLIITGGISPNFAGRVAPFSGQLSYPWQLGAHKRLTQAIHKTQTKIVLQILHAGRYAYHPFNVSASAIKAPINKWKPRELTHKQVEKSIDQFVNCARLAQQAGYDGVEIMGSEGYFINQFIAKRTNHRRDQWGGSYQNRIRLPLEIVKRTRAAVGEKFLIIYRISLMDLVEDGSSWEEIVELAKKIESVGASILNTGIGWHEARVPTIATVVPHGAFVFTTEKLKQHVSIPCIAVNRFNDPLVAEKALLENKADLVSMARPFLADAEIVNKTKMDRLAEINTCIACNQACLDHIFLGKRATCLVNPRACYELDYQVEQTTAPKKVLVVGAGPAGLSCATTAAKRGHHVTLLEASDSIGGQFRLAMKIPGKEDFKETIRYYQKQIELFNIQLKLNTTFKPELTNNFDQVIWAAGVKPKIAPIKGHQNSKVMNYQEFLDRPRAAKKIVIIGGGGVALDVATFILHKAEGNFYDFWGIDQTLKERGGLKKPQLASDIEKPQVTILKRSEGKFGVRSGKSTSWIHRLSLKKLGVVFIDGVHFKEIDDEGVHTLIAGNAKSFPADLVILCTGQEPMKHNQFKMIGGASGTLQELDAKKAIREGFESALSL